MRGLMVELIAPNGARVMANSEQVEELLAKGYVTAEQDIEQREAWLNRGLGEPPAAA